MLLGTLAVVGCERNEPSNTNTPSRTTPTNPTTTTPTTPSTRSDSGRTPDSLRENHDQAITAWRHQLDDIKTKVDQLKQKASNAGDNKAEFQTTVSNLSDQVDKLQARLNDYKDTGVSNWESYRSETESAFIRLNNSLRDAMEKFGSTTTTPTSPSSPSPNPMPTPTPEPSPSPSPTPSTPPNPNPG